MRFHYGHGYSFPPSLTVMSIHLGLDGERLKGTLEELGVSEGIYFGVFAGNYMTFISWDKEGRELAVNVSEREGLLKIRPEPGLIHVVAPFFCNSCKKTTKLRLQRPVSEFGIGKHRNKVLQMVAEDKHVHWEPPDTPDGTQEVERLEKETSCSHCGRGFIQFVWSFGGG